MTFLYKLINGILSVRLIALKEGVLQGLDDRPDLCQAVILWLTLGHNGSVVHKVQESLEFKEWIP